MCTASVFQASESRSFSGAYGTEPMIASTDHFDALSAPQPLVLASASPRRAALLREAGCDFEVVPPPLTEPSLRESRTRPGELAEALAYFKARAVTALRPTAHVLGADTIVVLRGRVIGKPADARHAREILSELSGSRHQVITGVALLSPRGCRRLIAHEVTELYMRPMSEAELEAYLAGGEWQGKAGAYAIQESGDRFVSIVHGSLSNVVGLPMELLGALVRCSASAA